MVYVMVTKIQKKRGNAGEKQRITSIQQKQVL